MANEEDAAASTTLSAFQAMTGIPPQANLSEGTFQSLASEPDGRVLQRFDTLEAAKGKTQYALSAVPEPTLATIYRPGMPIRMVSALDPTALKEGEFSLLQNVRPDNDVITARYPTTFFGGHSSSFGGVSGASAGLVSARGVWSGNLNGTQYVVQAWYDGTAVRLYSSTNGYTFTEVTSTSSSYGYTGDNTSSRFPDSGTNCCFQSVTNTNAAGMNTDYLVIQNGVTNPMLYSPNAVNSAYVFPIQEVTAPVNYLTTSPSLSCGSAPELALPGFFNLTWTYNTAHVDSTLTFGSLTGNKIPLTSSSMVAGSQASFSTASASNYFIGTTQLCVLLDYSSGGDVILSQCKIEVLKYPANTWVSVYDPTVANPVGAPPAVVLLDKQIANNPSAVFAWNNEALLGLEIGGLRVTAPAGFPATTGTTTWNIYGFYAGGSSNTPYGSGLAVSYSNTGTLTESGGVILPPSTSTPSFASVGVYAGFSGSLPQDENLFYNLSIPAVASTQWASGVDALNLYISLPGSSTYGFSNSVGVASHSSGAYWTATTTSLATASSAPVDTYTAPDAYITSMPQGSCIASGGGRSFVGSGSKYWFSEYGFPFRFRLILDVTSGVARASSGGYVALPGTEKCAAWAVTGTSALGQNNFFLWTDRSTYAVSGPDGQSLSSPTLLASVGCSAPGSVAVYQDSIFFLDDNYQIRKFGYGQSQFYFYQNVNSYQLMQPISKRVVDDQTKGIPASRVQFAVGEAAYDRYYFAYTPPGGSSNSLMLIWDATIGCWIQDAPTVSGATTEAICPTVTGGTKTVYCQSSDLDNYQWENSSSSGTVNVKIQSAAMNPGGFSKTFFGRVGLVADIQAGQSLTVAKTLIAGGNAYGTVSSDSSSIDMATGVSGGQVFRWDSKSTLGGTETGPTGMNALTCQITFGPLAMTPGSRIFAIVQEQSPAAPGADAQ
jgi:hypothetical protein